MCAHILHYLATSVITNMLENASRALVASSSVSVLNMLAQKLNMTLEEAERSLAKVLMSSKKVRSYFSNHVIADGISSISVFEVIYKINAMIKVFAPPNQAPFPVNECGSGQPDPPNQAHVK
ncbi:hypothetical protein GH733_018410 [Mirounga leonina]|nr:hypothetical protein GH733_018410 [Mirounga leonina]